jgi:hypothetical protein
MTDARVASMRFPILDEGISRALKLAAITFFGAVLASAQNSTPLAAQTASPKPASDSVLPDAPPPAPKPFVNLQTPARSAAENSTNNAITVLENTLIRLETTGPLDSNDARDRDEVRFPVSADVVVGDVVAIPRGAVVHGLVLRPKKPGVLTGSPELTLKLTSLDLGGRNYPLYSNHLRVTGTSKTKLTENLVVGGAAVGALAGSLAYSKNGRTSAAGSARSIGKGAAVGAGVGTALAATTPGPELWIPPEAQVDFYLAAPISVIPASAEEAARLEQGLVPGGPSLYVRGDIP